MSNAKLSVEESAALLRAIFPELPGHTGDAARTKDRNVLADLASRSGVARQGDSLLVTVDYRFCMCCESYMLVLC
jgi:hypothetical protein